MKINVTGKVSVEAIKSILDEQKAKADIIEQFCKDKKIKELDYQDAILEYSYKKVGGKNE